MQVLQTFGTFFNDGFHVQGDELRPLAHFDFQVLGVEQLHRDKRESVQIVEVEDLDHVGMINTCTHFGFMLEVFNFFLVITKIAQQNLQCHTVAFPLFLGLPDLGRRAGSDEANQLKRPDKVASYTHV